MSLFQQSLVPRHERPVTPSSWRESGLTVVSKVQGANHVLQDAVASGSQGLNALQFCAFPEMLMDTTQCSLRSGARMQTNTSQI